MNNKNLELKVEDDFLLEEVLEGVIANTSPFAFLDEPAQKPAYLDEIQLGIEKAALGFCLEKGFVPYGAVIDSICWATKPDSWEFGRFGEYAKKKWMKEKSSREIKEGMVDLGERIRQSLSESAEKYSLESIENALAAIEIRYARYAYSEGDKRKRIKKEDMFKEKRKYEVLWVPSFRRLKEKYEKARQSLPQDFLLIRAEKNTGAESDELIDNVKTAEDKERNMNEVTNFLKHPCFDAAQLKIEKEIFSYCIKNEFQPYGTVMDALLYLTHRKSFDEKCYHYESENASKRFSKSGVVCLISGIRKNVADLASSIEDAFLSAIGEYNRKSGKADKMGNLIAGSILSGIYSRYAQYSRFNEFRRWASTAGKKARDPYDIIWEPWFKGLNKQFWQARKYFELEKDGKKFRLI
jgi:hypothetical protein